MPLSEKQGVGSSILPLATKMSYLKKNLKIFRKIILSDFRDQQLATYFSNIILKNITTKNIKILDFGSGYNPKVILSLENKLSMFGFETNIYCVDFYSNTDLKILNSESKNISFMNFDEFERINTQCDLAIISDVLHHIGIESLADDKNLNKVLKSKFVLIKDHFEYSLLTRYILIFMDFIGNYKDSVSVPKNYFNRKNYENFLQKNNLKIVDNIENIKLYSSFYFPFNLKKIQFIHLLKENN